jgi:hypothetical protein
MEFQKDGLILLSLTPALLALSVPHGKSQSVVLAFTSRVISSLPFPLLPHTSRATWYSVFGKNPLDLTTRNIHFSVQAKGLTLDPSRDERLSSPLFELAALGPARKRHDSP